jgi:DNA polymerase I-like protein with 3'-5' exonuclease and polymerase domains
MCYLKIKIEYRAEDRTGQYSTDEDTLSKLSHGKIVKKSSTSVAHKIKINLRGFASGAYQSRTGRVHTISIRRGSYGKIEFDNPNLQNIPIH